MEGKGVGVEEGLEFQGFLNRKQNQFQLANILTALLAYSILPLQTAFTSWRLFLGEFPDLILAS